MTTAQLVIRKLTEADIEAVTAIHLEQFPNARSTSLGKPYLRKMYHWFMETQPALSFVAVQSDRVVGFAVGAIGGYGRKIFRYALAEIILGLARRPGLLIQKKTYTLWSSYLRGLLPTRRPTPLHQAAQVPVIVRCSLSSIAVAQTAQRQGVGKALIAALEENARHLGAARITLSVASNNLPARRLYECCGWQCIEDRVSQASIVYVKHLSD
jgi:ribosomal protein S18 acetylase RimI-like enzyme